MASAIASDAWVREAVPVGHSAYSDRHRIIPSNAAKGRRAEVLCNTIPETLNEHASTNAERTNAPDGATRVFTGNLAVIHAVATTSLDSSFNTVYINDPSEVFE